MVCPHFFRQKIKNRFMLKYSTNQTLNPGNLLLLVLIFSVVWLLMLLAWYLVGFADRSGYLPTFVLRENGC